MKILFSADWHLGYTLGGANQQHRLDDQVRQLNLIARYIEQHGVDVLAIAGDVFEAQDRGPARAAIHRMVDALAVPLARGLTVVAIAGNHDRDYFMETANVWLGAASGEASSRFVLRTRPELITLGPEGDRVSFALLPYPTPVRYDLRQEDAGSAADRNERLAQRFIEEMTRLQLEAAQLQLPTVLLSHITVQGVSVGAHRISARDDITIPRSAFPAFELSVLGHIHKAERMGSGEFYYVGALDRMDAGERDYQPRVLLADIGPTGVREVHSLPLDPTPIVEVRATGEDDLRSARAFLTRPEDTLVKVRLTVPHGASTGPLIALARELFPRLYGNIEHEWLDDDGPRAAVDGLNPADVIGTLRRYLEEREDDPEERAALLDLVHELRAERA